MKLSVSIIEHADENAPFLLRGDYAESIKSARKIGYDAVELHIRDPKMIDLHAFKNMCEKESIEVSSIGTGLARGMDGLSFMSNDLDTRRKTLTRMEEFIKAGKILNATVIIGLIKGIVPPDEEYEACENKVKDMVLRCLEFAELNNVQLAFEAINRYESNFLTNIDEVTTFIKQFNSELLKVHIDTFHMNIEETNMTDSILRCNEHIGHVHFADSDRMYPGHGHIPFVDILNALRKIRYKGFIAVECLPLPEPVEAAKRSWKYLHQLVNV